MKSSPLSLGLAFALGLASAISFAAEAPGGQAPARRLRRRPQRARPVGRSPATISTATSAVMAGDLPAQGLRELLRFLQPAARPLRGAGARIIEELQRRKDLAAGQRRAEGARLLRQLHGPAARDAAGIAPLQAGAGPDRRDRHEGRADRRLRQRRPRRQHRAGRLRRRAGPQESRPVPGQPRRRRPGPAGQGLLPQSGRALRRHPQGLRRAHRQDARLCRRRRTAKARAEAVLALETALAKPQWERAKRRDRDKTYNATTFAELQKQYPGYDWAAHFKAQGMPHAGKVNVATPERGAAGARGDRRHAARRCGATTCLPRRRRQRAVPQPTTSTTATFAFNGTVLSGQKAQRDAGSARSAMVGSNRPGRSDGQDVRQRALHAGIEGGDGRAGREPARCAAPEHREAGLDGRRRPRPRPTRSSRPSVRRSATRTSGATTPASTHRAERPDRQRDGACAVLRPATTRPPRRQADRPRRMGHDAADGQRLLQPDRSTRSCSRPRSCSRRSST